MKRSNYNIFLPKRNSVLGYNAFTDSYIAISHNAHKAFTESDINHFENEYPSVCKSFKGSGFIIDDDLDELGAIRFINKKQTFNSRDYYLMIYPTQDCNLKCWYCFENHVKDSRISDEVIDSIVNHISSKLEKKEIDFLHVTFFGGEPLLYFDDTVYPLLKRIKELCNNSSIPFYPFFITNASLINEDVILKLKPFSPMFQITIDGNKGKHDKVRIGKTDNHPTFDKIIASLKLISTHISSEYELISRIVTLRINYDNQTLKNVNSVINNIAELDKSKIFIHFERVWQTKNSVNERQILYLKEAIARFSKAGFKVGHGIFGKRAYSCPAEVYNYAVINYDGLVYRCNGRNLTPESAEGKLLPNGEIEWNEVNLIKRLARSTFENKKCLVCKMLPQCMGPCSQKQLEKGWGNIDEICSRNMIDLSLEDYLTLDFEVRHLINQAQK